MLIVVRQRGHLSVASEDSVWPRVGTNLRPSASDTVSFAFGASKFSALQLGMSRLQVGEADPFLPSHMSLRSPSYAGWQSECSITRSLRGTREMRWRMLSRRADSNCRPAVYETAALPLSYVGAGFPNDSRMFCI